MKPFAYPGPLPFSNADIARIRNHVLAERRRSVLHYDMDIVDVGSWEDERGRRTQEVVNLTSEALGYDFSLCKVDEHRIVPGLSVAVIDLYVSRRGEGRFSFFIRSNTLRSALIAIDSIYNAAAAEHLP